MRLKTRKSRLTAFVAATMLFLPSAAQAQLYEVPLAQRIRIAESIVEGRVLHSESYWGAGQRSIYTSHVIEVLQTLKGPALDVVEVVTIGGEVEGEALVVSHSLQLAPGRYGIFFLQQSGRFPPHFDGQAVAWEVYAGMQGFIAITDEQGADPFRLYADLGREVFAWIPGCTTTGPVVRPPVLRGTATTAIDTIFPDTLAAGTRSSLFIRGTEFGAVRGKVRFWDADDGGASWTDVAHTDIQLWTDTLIEVWVPSIGAIAPGAKLIAAAGTGPVQIKTFTGTKVESADTLFVPYSIGNWRRTFDTVSNYISIADFNALGGITFRMDSSFSAFAPATALVKKSLRRWRCLTGINFRLGTDTTVNVTAKDSVSIIRWATGADSLDAGVLGQTQTFVEDCLDGTTFEILYFPVDIDILFRDTTIMFYDSVAAPGPAQSDFFSVTMHELGHAHQLGHVIDAHSLMHYARSLGDTVRFPGSNVLAGANWVIDSSTNLHLTCPPPMIAVNPADCYNLNDMPDWQTREHLIEATIFPNPAYSGFSIDLKLAPRDRLHSIEICDIAGRVIRKETNSMSRKSYRLLEFPDVVLPKGMNFVTIRTKYGAKTLKLIVL